MVTDMATCPPRPVRRVALSTRTLFCFAAAVARSWAVGVVAPASVPAAFATSMATVENLAQVAHAVSMKGTTRRHADVKELKAAFWSVVALAIAG